MADAKFWERYLQNDVVSTWRAYQAAVGRLDEFMVAQHRGGESLAKYISNLEEMSAEEVSSLEKTVIDRLDTELADLSIPTRIMNMLKEGGIQTVRQVLEDKRAERLSRIRNMGPKSLRKLAQVLEEAGYVIPNGWKESFPKE